MYRHTIFTKWQIGMLVKKKFVSVLYKKNGLSFESVSGFLTLVAQKVCSLKKKVVTWNQSQISHFSF